jgi:hypothetical protein
MNNEWWNAHSERVSESPWENLPPADTQTASEVGRVIPNAPKRPAHPITTITPTPFFL